MSFDIHVTAFSWSLSLLPHFLVDTYVVFYVCFDGEQHNFLICTQSIYLLNFFLNIVEIMDVPIKVAVQYSHRLSNIPHDNKAGPRTWQDSLML